MASRKSLLSKPNRYIFQTTSDTHLSIPTSHEGMFEFEEAEVWNHTTLDQPKNKGLPSSGSRNVLKRGTRNKVDSVGSRVTAASLPVNIPDWSKILKEDYKEHPKWESDVEDDEEEENENGGIRVPPHEYLARTRGASLSVHEGIGRTLKGRDLRSVRNAIWKKVGFED